jgi:hypothetical protein
MIRRRRGSVVAVAEPRPGIQELSVAIDGATETAISYPPLIGAVAVGDVVLLNTTAIDLDLGSGGYHFVIAVEGRAGQGPLPGGHIMKLRYTPHQAKVLTVEEQSSAHHELIDSSEELDGLPVLWLPLHSMLGSACAGAKLAGASRVVHVMTDGACLPLWFSSQVHELRRAGLVDQVITAGQALGGDHEAVNLFSALIAARAVCGADVAVVCDGVGKVGTGTRWGASDVSGGLTLNTAAILHGRPVASLRINFADAGYRHYGLSPHSITVLSRIAPSPVDVAVPVLKGEQHSLVNEALQAHGIPDRHRLHEVDGGPAVDLLRRHGIRIETMGRSVDEDPAFFRSSGAAGILAGEIAMGRRD